MARARRGAALFLVFALLVGMTGCTRPWKTSTLPPIIVRTVSFMPYCTAGCLDIAQWDSLVEPVDGDRLHRALDTDQEDYWLAAWQNGQLANDILVSYQTECLGPDWSK